MKNVDRLAKYIAANGPESIMIHTVPGTSNWIVCQKIGDDKWLLTLCNPMGNVTYNLGTVDQEQHLELWMELTKKQIEDTAALITTAKSFKEHVYNFKKRIKDKKASYKKFIKTEIKKANKK